jgi:hypothetical protein
MQAVVWGEVVVETDHATFVHITQPVRQKKDGAKRNERNVAGVLKTCFDKHEGVLVSNTGPTDTDTKVREYLKQTQIDEKTFLAKTTDEHAKKAKQAEQKEPPPLSTKVAFCLLIPANPEQFERKADRIINHIVGDQTAPGINDNDFVKKRKDQLDKVCKCTTSKQYVTLELYCKGFLALNVLNLYPYFVDVFYALHKLHSRGIAHGWVRTHSVCVSKLDPTTSSQDVCAGLARFDYSYDINYGPIMDHHATILQTDFVDPGIKALYKRSKNANVDVFRKYATQLDLYALFVVIYKLLDTKRRAVSDDDFERWVAACSENPKEDNLASLLNGVHKFLDGVTFKPAGDCCIGLVQAFGLANSPDDAKSWLIARYKPGPPKVKPTTKVTFGRSLNRPKRPKLDNQDPSSASTAHNEASTHHNDQGAHELVRHGEDLQADQGAQRFKYDKGAKDLGADENQAKHNNHNNEPDDDHGIYGDAEGEASVLADTVSLVDYASKDAKEERRVVCLKWESKHPIRTTPTLANPKTTTINTNENRGGEHYPHKLYVHNELNKLQLKALVESEKHLKRFRHKEYIDDHTMNLFNHMIPLEKHVFITVCAAQASFGLGRKPAHLCPTPSHTVVYIPIAYLDNHWFFIRVNREDRVTSITVFDSRIKTIPNRAYPSLIENAMVQFGLVQDTYEFAMADTPQQREVECGFFACLRIWYACTNQDVSDFEFEKLGAYKEPPRLFVARCILENCIPVVLRGSFVDVFPNQYLVTTDSVTWAAWRTTRTILEQKPPPFLRHITQPPSYPLSFSSDQADALKVSSDWYFGVSRTVLPLNNSTYLMLAATRHQVNVTKKDAKRQGCEIAKQTILGVLEQMKNALYGYDDLRSFMHLVGVASVYSTVIQLPFVLRRYHNDTDAQASYEASKKAVEELQVTLDVGDDEELDVVRDDQDDASSTTTFRGDCETLRPLVINALEAQLDTYTACVVRDLWETNEGNNEAWTIVNTALLTAARQVDFKEFAKHATRPDGDCFYQCVCKAIGRASDVDGVRALRLDIYRYFVDDLEPKLLVLVLGTSGYGGAVSDHHLGQYLDFKGYPNNTTARTALLEAASRDINHAYFGWYFTTKGIYADQFGMIVAAMFTKLSYVEARFVVRQQAWENVPSGQRHPVEITVNVSCEKINGSNNFMVLLFSGLSNYGHFDLLMPKPAEAIDLSSPNRQHRDYEEADYEDPDYEKADYGDKDDKEKKAKQVNVLEWLKSRRQPDSQYELSDYRELVATLDRAAIDLRLDSESFKNIPKQNLGDGAEGAWRSLFTKSGSGYPGSVQLGVNLFSVACQLGMDIVYIKNNVLQTLPHATKVKTGRIYVVQDGESFYLLSERPNTTTTKEGSGSDQSKERQGEQGGVTPASPRIVTFDHVRIVDIDEEVF